jgi:hypothetical protein
MPRPNDAKPQPGDPDEVLAELEAAWARWVSGNPSDDARVVSLLRAAFAAGYEAGHDEADGKR